MSAKWIRTCQECLNRQEDIKPNPEKGIPDSWCDRKCRKCKSQSLDYGCEEVE